MSAEALRAIYEKLPQLDCKGKCQASCGPIIVSPGEAELMVEAADPPVDPPPINASMVVIPGNPMCPFLKDDGRCQVYEGRPMICRLWGTVESMPCMFGCVPEGGHLSDIEGFTLLAQAIEAGDGSSEVSPEAIGALFGPEGAKWVKEFLGQGMEADARRQAEIEKAGGYTEFIRRQK